MRAILIFAAASGFAAVAIGAMGAHMLRGRLDTRAIDWIETAVRYQMWHALALLAAAALMAWRPGRPGRSGRSLVVAGWAWAAGTVLFSGGLYLLAFTGIGAFASIVPFGGAAFLVGWAALVWYGVSALRHYP